MRGVLFSVMHVCVPSFSTYATVQCDHQFRKVSVMHKHADHVQ